MILSKTYFANASPDRLSVLAVLLIVVRPDNLTHHYEDIQSDSLLYNTILAVEISVEFIENKDVR
jgi:hypothetical protein